MKLVVNGEARDVKAQTMAELVIELGYEDVPVATAVNRKVVRKVERAATPLHQGDQIEILIPMQGG